MSISPPYYVKPAPLWVDCGKFYGFQPTALSMLQQSVASMLGHVDGFIGPNPTSKSPEDLIQSFVDYAKLLASYPYAMFTAPSADLNTQGMVEVYDTSKIVNIFVGAFNPVTEGKFYASLVINTLKDIPFPAATIFDGWVQGR